MVVDGVAAYSAKPSLCRAPHRHAMRITSRMHPQDMDKKRGGAVSGRLSEMGLLDWMTSLEQGRKTCALVLSSGNDKCTLYFTEGQVSHATYGDKVGDEAVFKVLCWTEGDWELDFAKTSSERTTTMSTQGLMMEGLRLLDEANRDAG